MKLVEKIINIFDLRNDACFEEHKDEDGKCYGLVGGSKSTDYLSEHCMSCKHHTLLIKD
jgi:hypothetical protein